MIDPRLYRPPDPLDELQAAVAAHTVDETAVPVGVTTYNRADYLDLTLRSLSATLAGEQPLVFTDRSPASQTPPGSPTAVTSSPRKNGAPPVYVFDDVSDDKRARDYLYTDAELPPGEWPDKSDWWQSVGFDSLGPVDRPITGIAAKVPVVRNHKQSVGVVNNSTRAIRWMFTQHPHAPAVVLLQDDVVFRDDWYDDMLKRSAMRLRDDRPLAILAGVHLNGKVAVPQHPVRNVTWCSGQCLLITREFYEREISRSPCAEHSYFLKTHRNRHGYDTTICQTAQRLKFDVYLCHPFVCQHFGFVSSVRKNISWKTRHPDGRIGYHASPPYRAAAHVDGLTAGFANVPHPALDFPLLESTPGGAIVKDRDGNVVTKRNPPVVKPPS